MFSGLVLLALGSIFPCSSDALWRSPAFELCNRDGAYCCPYTTIFDVFTNSRGYTFSVIVLENDIYPHHSILPEYLDPLNFANFISFAYSLPNDTCQINIDEEEGAVSGIVWVNDISNAYMLYRWAMDTFDLVSFGKLTTNIAEVDRITNAYVLVHCILYSINFAVYATPFVALILIFVFVIRYPNKKNRHPYILHQKES